MKITEREAKQMCAEIVPEWDGLFDIHFDRLKPFTDRNAAARLVEAFVGEDTDRRAEWQIWLTNIVIENMEEKNSWPTYEELTATARQRTLAVLSAYKGEIVEVEG